MNATKITTAQAALLRALVAQASAAARWPRAYSADLFVGSVGCHKAVAEALIARDLVTVGARPYGRYITINDAGRAALIAAEAAGVTITTTIAA